MISFFALLAPAAALAPLVVQGSPTIPDPILNASSSVGHEFFSSTDGSLTMRATHDLSGKRVRIRHYHFHDLPARLATIVESNEVVPYWPTSSAPFVNSKLLVAGRSPRSGNTILELWTVAPPSVVLSTSAGSPSVLQPGTVVEKSELLNKLHGDMDVIMRMHAMRSSGPGPTHVLIQFFGSRDVYSLEVAQGTLVRVASPTTHPNCHTLPLLSQGLTSQVRHHQNEGFLYIFAEQILPPDTASVVILRDTNMDSVIDGASTYTGAQYEAAGYTSSVWID